MVLTSMIKKGLIEAIPAEAGAPVWREAEDGTPLTLVAAAAAYMVLGIITDTGADSGPEEEPAADMADEAESPPTDAHVAKPARKPREGTKQEALIAMLKRPEGASIAEIMEATAWQAHSIRGFIAGALKKKLGLNVTSEKIEGRGRVYKLDSAV
jgi:nanoRNase/pAp phosphatase (c-di-AMP/oligoRNAs hydrolase)